MVKHKRSTTTGNVRIVKKIKTAKREQNSLFDRASQWLGVATLLCKCWGLLESLPLDHLQHFRHLIM